MKRILGDIFRGLRGLVRREEGQDMVEYALVVALIAFAATAGMKNLATGVNTAFDHISTALASDVT